MTDLAKKLHERHSDYMIATGEDLRWLAEQLCAWPHRRVHPDRTMSDQFLRHSAAQTMLAQAATLEREQQPLMLCRHCGRFENENRERDTVTCAPPFKVQPHEFTQPHPYLTEPQQQPALEREPDEAMVEQVARAITLCPVCEGEGTPADGLDEAACSTPCPPCFGTGFDARAAIAAMKGTSDD